MEIILNELSLDGQFTSDDEFAKCLRESIIPVMIIIEETGQALLKSQRLYQCMVTGGSCIHDYLRMSNQTEFTTLKRFLVSLMSREPFWENDSKYEVAMNYDYPGKCQEPNAITEAMDRRGMLLSFSGTAYDKESTIQTKKGEEIIHIFNVLSPKGMLRCLVEKSGKWITYAVERYPISAMQKIVVCDECAKVLNEIDCDERDRIKILENLPQMIDDKSHGKKSHWWDSYQGDVYEYRVTISRGEFRIYFTWENKIRFLWALLKKTQKPGRAESERIMSLEKKYRNMADEV